MKNISQDDDLMLLDLSSFIFFQYSKTLNWYKQYTTSKDFSNVTDDKVFVDKYMKNCHRSINALARKHDIKKDNIFLVKDCPRKNNWRKQIFEKYKSQRKRNKEMDSRIFPISYQIFEERYNVLYHDHLEADDVIAICVNRLKKKPRSRQRIIIISNDHDFIQLGVYKNTFLYDLTGKDLMKNIDPVEYLKEKVIRGDRSDNIKELDSRHFNIKKFHLNEKLIKFDNIPTQYVKEFLKSVRFKNSL